MINVLAFCDKIFDRDTEYESWDYVPSYDKSLIRILIR